MKNLISNLDKTFESRIRLGIMSVLSVNENVANTIASISAEHGLTGILGEGGFQILGVLFFVSLAIILYKVAIKNNQPQL